MDLVIPPTEFYGVEFPGIVKNVDRAVEMLGGYSQISKAFWTMQFYSRKGKVFADHQRRLNLCFRPHMLYAKPACGDGHQVNALVMKVQRLRNKRTGEIKVVPVILGRVSRLYRFTGMADFQYGPYEHCTNMSNLSDSSQSNEYKLFYKDLIIDEPTTMIDSYLLRDTPLFLPPVLFSRLDSPSSYQFAPLHKSIEYIELEEQAQKLPLNRKSRPNYGYIVNLDNPTPMNPHPGALARLESLGTPIRILCDHLQKLFNERPIWLRSALLFNMPPGVRLTDFKAALAACAYYMVRGPWSRGWIRFGYDPRTNPESRRYQSYMIVRKLLRHSSIKKRMLSTDVTRRLFVENRELNNPVVNKDEPNTTQISSNIVGPEVDSDHNDADDDNPDDYDYGEDDDDNDDDRVECKRRSTNSKESDFRIGPNHLPTAHQVRYCLIDIEIPEVQALLDEIPERTEFDLVEGWFKPGSVRRIRDLLAQYLKKWISEIKSGMQNIAD